MVPGRIFEKKTALWVYEKISRVQHDDPALLIYKSRTELQLHVFPFGPQETRRVELELVYPNTVPPKVSVGDTPVLLPQQAHDTPLAPLTVCQTPSGSVAIAEGPGLADFSLQRRPYLHILIDCSEGSTFSAESLALSLQQARAAFPEADLARVTAVNFEARDLVSDLVPVAQLDAAALQKDLLACRGGFLEDRFLKRGLLQAYDLTQKGDADAIRRPQFVIISSHGQSPLREGHLEAFLALVPDARIIIYAPQPGARSSWEDMVGHAPIVTPQPMPVALWRWDGHYAVSSAGTRLVATFPGAANPADQPLLYQAATGQFVALSPSAVVPPTSRFADGVRTWAAQDEASLDPSLLQHGAGALLGLSKQTGILIPDSSYIVVESSSQWRILEEKEKLKLKNKQVFEFEEPSAAAAVPEPGTWIALAFVFALFLARRIKSRVNPLRLT